MRRFMYSLYVALTPQLTWINPHIRSRKLIKKMKPLACIVKVILLLYSAYLKQLDIQYIGFFTIKVSKVWTNWVYSVYSLHTCTHTDKNIHCRHNVDLSIVHIANNWKARITSTIYVPARSLFCFSERQIKVVRQIIGSMLWREEHTPEVCIYLSDQCLLGQLQKIWTDHPRAGKTNNGCTNSSGVS